MKRYFAIALKALCVVLAALTMTSVHAAPQPTKEIDVSVEQRIDFYKNKLAQHPRLFVIHTQLAAAYLDKAREALDPEWLQLAEASLNDSLKIYPNFDAYKGLLVLNAYRHQFAEARRWGEMAHKLFPDDHEVIAVLVEADLGLGDIDSALRRLPLLGSEPDYYHIAVAMANIYKAQGKFDDARKFFLKAEQLGHAFGFIQLAAWARTNAAGMLIDTGRAREARPDLEAATALRKGDAILRLHWAEYHDALDEPTKALNILESMLEDAPHPSFHFFAYRMSKKLGDKHKARQHFNAAEQGYLLALQANEIYTLGSLASLYCEAGVKLSKALHYAQRNLEYKRDDEAQEALRCVQDKLKKPTKRSKSKT